MARAEPRRGGAAFPTSAVDIVGRASRMGQPPPGAASYELPRGNGLGMPAAPPASAAMPRFTPPAPAARQLSPATDGRPFRSPLGPPSAGSPERAFTPQSGAPSYLLPHANGAPGRALLPRDDAERPDGAPAPPLPRPGGIPTRPSPPPDGAPARPLPPPGGAPTYFVQYPNAAPARPLPPPGNGVGAAPSTANGAAARPLPPPGRSLAPSSPPADGAPARPVPWTNGTPPRQYPAPAAPGAAPPAGQQPAAPPHPPPQRGLGNGLSRPMSPPPGGQTANGGSASDPRHAPGERPARPGAEFPAGGGISTPWLPLPDPALASPQRPLSHRTVGRLAALAPEPGEEGPARPAPAPPRTAQDFAPERVMGPEKVRPATRGLRRAVRSISFGAIAPGPSRAERRERELVATAITPIATCRKVAIVSRKGGIGKTTTTLMLGHTFAAHRRDKVVALDANPDAGSLAYRVRRETDATVTQLLRASERIHRYSDMRSFTSQSATRLEVLASDDDPTISVALGEAEYRQVLHVLEHHYNLILMDTGTGILDLATQGLLRMTDQIVVCAAPGIDASRASSLTLDWLDEHGYRDMVSDAVVVINQVRSSGSRELRQVADHFAKRCRAVVKVPWDPHLAEGLEVDVDDLRHETRTAYLNAVAAVARSFALPSRHP